MLRGTFLGIEVAKKGILSARGAMDTTSHNISNAYTEGYSRQRSNIRASSPINFPGPFVTLRPGQLGTGAEIVSIERIHSQLIESQIHREGGSRTMFQTMTSYFTRVEDVIGEPSDDALNGLMEGFFNSWEDLSNDPESQSTRVNVRAAANALTTYVNEIDLKLDLEVQNLNQEIEERVMRLNNLAFQVADINKQIAQIEGSGQPSSLKANDLKDRRDVIIEEISQLVNARVLFNNNGTASVLIQGHPLVSGEFVNDMRIIPNTDDFQRPKIVFRESNIPVEIEAGELKGLMEMRDVEIPAVRENIGRVVSVLINRVNRLHRDGYGLDGQTNRPFFQDIETRRIQGSLSMGPGVDLETTLDDLGITTGDFYIQGERIKITQEDIQPADAITLAELIERIESKCVDVRMGFNNVGGVNRFTVSQFNPIDINDSLTIKGGTSNFLSVMNLDTGKLEELALDPPYSNALQDFKLHPSINNTPDAIAAAGNDGNGFPGPGDNRTALAIGDLKNSNLEVFGTTISEHYQSVIAELGNAAQNTERNRNSQTLVVEQLTARRQEVSGVNLDEEAVSLIKYQKAFEASSRAMTALDEVLTLIVTRLGIAGR
jgi:flagellar hook-associated protein 1 FlgK